MANTLTLRPGVLQPPIYPILWEKYETSRPARNIVHETASGTPVVTVRPASARRCRVRLLFDSEIAATVCEIMHRDAIMPLIIDDTDLPSAGMQYIVDGRILREQDPKTPGVWFVEADVIDVTPRKTLDTAAPWVELARNEFTNPGGADDGTWAEVRRNSFPNPGPRTTAGIAAISANAPYPTLDVSSGWMRVTCNTTETHATTPRTQVVTTIGAASVTAGATATLKVDVRNSSGRNMSVDAWFMTAAGVYVSYISYPVTGLVAGEWKQLHYTPTVPAGAELMGYQIVQPSNVTPTVPGEWFEYRNLSTDPGGYFDGSTMDTTMPQPADFRTIWLDAVNASPSVVEIQNARGLVGVNCIAGVSSKLPGGCVRIIPTGVSNDSYVKPAASPTLAAHTILGTFTLDKPLTGVLHERRLGVHTNVDGTGGAAAVAPNEAGSTQLRGAATGSLDEARWYHGGARGSGDVWVSKPGIYAGNYKGEHVQGGSLSSAIERHRWLEYPDQSPSVHEQRRLVEGGAG